MHIIEPSSLLRPVADFEQLPEAFRHSRQVNPIENIRRVFSVTPQILG